ncbi:MAG: hypothetical protein WAK55_20855 [Xanthobacteraceae bacterium]
MRFYRIFVRLKTGGQGIGRKLCSGELPDLGTEFSVLLVTGRIVKARIVSHGGGSKRAGTAGSAFTFVYADEI